MSYGFMKPGAIVLGVSLILVAAVFLIKTASTEPKGMPVEEFGRHVRALRSIAAEMVVFSTELEKHKLTDSYAKIHCEKLQEEIRTTARQLDDPVPPEISESGARVRVIADTLSSQWRELRRYRADSKEISNIRQQAIRLEQELGDLGAAL